MIPYTNALSAWAEGLSTVEIPLRSADQLVVPSIVLGEYYFRIRQSRHRARYERRLRRCLPFAKVANGTTATADEHAGIRLALRRLGSPIPSNDVWTAAAEDLWSTIQRRDWRSGRGDVLRALRESFVAESDRHVSWGATHPIACRAWWSSRCSMETGWSGLFQPLKSI